VETKCLPFDPGVLALCSRHVSAQPQSQERRQGSSLLQYRRGTIAWLPTRTVQRTVLYLGEINDEQQAAWRKTLSVFDDQEQAYAKVVSPGSVLYRLPSPPCAPPLLIVLCPVLGTYRATMDGMNSTDVVSVRPLSH
jgi:hypothetical protein